MVCQKVCKQGKEDNTVILVTLLDLSLIRIFLQVHM